MAVLYFFGKPWAELNLKFASLCVYIDVHILMLLALDCVAIETALVRRNRYTTHTFEVQFMPKLD